MGGGMPIAAICAGAKIAEAFGMGAHGSTYGGNAVCCAAAYAQIDLLLESGAAARAKEMGEYFMDKLRTLPHVKEVRGKGLLMGVEFDAPIGLDVKHRCFDRKLLVTVIGDSLIRMVPPLILSKADCDQAYEILLQSAAEALEVYVREP
jgi:acetylornithine/N-succinyldiaminopimelate aminotransferase